MLKRRFKLIKQGLDDGAELSDLNDVSASSATNGQTIIWNGTAWVPGSLGDLAGDHGDLDGLADDDHPQYGAVAQDEVVTGDWTFSGLVRASEGGYEWLRLESDGATALSGSYMDLSSNVYSELLLRSYVDDDYGPSMTFYKARGTKASPTANVTGDQLGGFFWGSRGSSGWVFPAAVDFTTTANTTTTAAGHLDFKVGPNFAGLASLLRLYTSGDIGIRGPILLGSAEDVGTAGQILTSQGAGNDPTWEDAPTGGGGGGGASGSLTFLGSVTAGSAVTTLDSPVLDLDADGEYRVVIRGHAAAGSGLLSLYFNSDTTATNYDKQNFFGDGTGTAGEQRANNATIGTPTNGHTYEIDCIIRKNFDGNPFILLHAYYNDTTTVIAQTSYLIWRTTGANVTSLKLFSSAANSIDAGTTISVWKIAASGSSLDDLADVNTTTVAPRLGDELRWDGTNWITWSPRTHHYLFEDFTYGPYSTSGVGFWDTLNSGTGSSVGMSAVPGSATGVILCGTGTTTSGYAGVMRKLDASTAAAQGGYYIGNGTITFRALLEVSAPPDTTDRYYVRVGLGDEITSAPASGVYITTDWGVLGDGRWIGAARDGTLTYGTSPNIVTPVAGTWYLVEMVINAAGTRVDFYVDGVLVSVCTANIPVYGAPLWPIIQIQKNTGATSRFLRCDYVEIIYKFTTPRK